MKLKRYSVKYNMFGELERYLLTTYDINLCGNMLQVDGKQMPIKYKTGWAIYKTKASIFSIYTPEKFFNDFLLDESWRHSDYTYSILDHVRKFGKPV